MYMNTHIHIYIFLHQCSRIQIQHSGKVLFPPHSHAKGQGLELSLPIPAYLRNYVNYQTNKLSYSLKVKKDHSTKWYR